MKIFKSLIHFLFLVFLCDSTPALEIDQKSFEHSIYGVSEISHFTLDTQRFNRLSAHQKQDILLAKTVLLELLKAVQDINGNPNQYLSSAFNKQFPIKKSFAQSLLDEETSLIALIVGDFTIPEDNTKIILRFSVISSSEGNMVVTEKSATIQKMDAGWKLIGIK
jgi:hypothetical protein